MGDSQSGTGGNRGVRVVVSDAHVQHALTWADDWHVVIGAAAATVSDPVGSMVVAHDERRRRLTDASYVLVRGVDDSRAP